MTGGFADQTVVAAAWLICHAPERLKTFLAKHPDGDHLEKVARQYIQEQRERRKATAK